MAVGGLRIGKKLKTRYGAGWHLRRKAHMDYRNRTWNELAKNRGGLNSIASATQILANRQRVQNWALIVLVVAYVVLALKIFGVL